MMKWIKDVVAESKKNKNQATQNFIGVTPTKDYVDGVMTPESPGWSAQKLTWSNSLTEEDVHKIIKMYYVCKPLGITSQQLQAIEGHLAHKFDLVGKLGDWHPYKNQKPPEHFGSNSWPWIQYETVPLTKVS